MICYGCNKHYPQQGPEPFWVCPVCKGDLLPEPKPGLLSDYWSASTDKDAVLSVLPVPAHIGRCRVKTCRCVKADARECFVDRQPQLSKAALFARRECDCECHSH